MSLKLCDLSSDLLNEILLLLDNLLGYDRNIINLCLVCKTLYSEISKINNFWNDKIHRAFIPSCFDTISIKQLKDLENENKLMTAYFNLEYFCINDSKLPVEDLVKIENFEKKQLSISTIGNDCDKFYTGAGFGTWFQDGFYNHEYIYRKGRFEYSGLVNFAVNHKICCNFDSGYLYIGDEFPNNIFDGFIWLTSLWELTDWTEIERRCLIINDFYEGKVKIDEPEKPFFICLVAKHFDRETFEKIVYLLNGYIKRRGMTVSRLMYCNLLTIEPKAVMLSLLSRISKSFFSQLLNHLHTKFVPLGRQKKKCFLM
ncbi:Hypothetical protein NAEGRDRAFT_69216 [Naegleria gruberi]|uniref:F-box domain-containing protein n=1 Tax=Naegleria gruberi TaxID=5762 RepID=D2VJZ6_NAEGR|nr:uncharacterized protein NAEGRDRAFT_69216 [Naegleria gruberi]EFC42775.1 Hypothetical protein NAEGRDRAFT_69216 [Naegleria gruberi]|eukprot:XP_002675519.1 Hypothetical protein NAEGRDRAFT_69216 [Naegleria gruberi strain NEG-M]